MMLSESVNFFSSLKKKRKKLVLIVKDQEETIEGSVRRIVSSDILKKASLDSELIILDMGSTDKTLEVLEKLKNDLECVNIVTNSEKESIFGVFSQNHG
jgi:glycosyltransferase involved in cell wall biosynthesis